MEEEREKILLEQLEVQRRLEAERNKKSEADKTMKKGEDPVNYLTAYKNISLSKDWPYFFIIMFSVLADIFTLIPVVGNLFAFLFAALFWVIYLVFTDFSKSPAFKILSNFIAQAIEIFLPGINILPMFTIAAVVNYWVYLAKKEQ